MVTHLHVGFKVEDYGQWKEEYDASIEQRKASGELAFQVQALMDSPDLKARMKAAKITEMRQMLILEEMDSGTH